MTIAINSLSPEQWAQAYSPRVRTERPTLTIAEVAARTRGAAITGTRTPAIARAARRMAAEAAYGQVSAIKVDGSVVRYLDGVTWMIAGRI